MTAATFDEYKQALHAQCEPREVDARIRLTDYNQICQQLLNGARAAEHEGNLEIAYVKLFKFVSYVVHTLPKHPNYKNPEFKSMQSSLEKHASLAINRLEGLLKSIRAKFETNLKDQSNPQRIQISQSDISSNRPLSTSFKSQEKPTVTNSNASNASNGFHVFRAKTDSLIAATLSSQLDFPHIDANKDEKQETKSQTENKQRTLLELKKASAGLDNINHPTPVYSNNVVSSAESSNIVASAPNWDIFAQQPTHESNESHTSNDSSIVSPEQFPLPNQRETNLSSTSTTNKLTSSPVSATSDPSSGRRTRQKDDLFARRVGIRNAGAMCYVNSPLAILYRIPKINRLIDGNGGTRHTARPTALRRTLWAIRDALKYAATNGEQAINMPEGFDTALRSVGLNAEIGEAGDSQEAFSLIIDALAASRDDFSSQDSSDSPPMDTPFDMKLQMYRCTPDGSIHKLPITMERCLHVIIPDDLLYQPSHASSTVTQRTGSLARLSNATGSPPVALEKCVQEYFDPSSTNGSDGDRFISCLVKPPELLMVHIRRSEAAIVRSPDTDSSTTQTGADIACPHTLELPVLSDQSNHSSRYCTFRLRAVISHQRLKNQVNDIGHYVAIVREQHSRKAILYDDSSVTEYSEQEDAACAPQQVYLVIYEKLGQ